MRLATVGLTIAGQPWAQPRAVSVPVPGKSTASSDDASAIALNPANLSFMPGMEARWDWSLAPEDALDWGRGHAFSLGTVVPFIGGTGVRVDVVRPPVSSPDHATPYDEPYTWLTWGLGIGGSSAALGISVRHLYTTEPATTNPTTVSLGLSSRPSSRLGVSFVAHNLGAPRDAQGREPIDRSYTLATAFRPWSKRSFEIALEGTYHEGFYNAGRYTDTAHRYRIDHGWVPKAVIGVDVPYVGRLTADAAYVKGRDQDRNLVASAMLDLNYGPTTARIGPRIGPNSNGDTSLSLAGGLAIRTWQEPGLPRRSWALKISLNKPPSEREHVTLLRKLWQVADEPDIQAVVLQIKTSAANSWSNAYELDDAVKLLRSRGKSVVCHLDSASGTSLLTCANSDRIVISPAGGVRFAGLRLQTMYFASLLQDIGVNAQFIRIAEHKSAPEQLTRKGPTSVSQQDRLENVMDATGEFISAITTARKLSSAQAKRIIDSGPHSAKEAIAYRLVDGFAFDDELETVVSEVTGKSLRLVDTLPTKAAKRFGSSDRVAIVYVDGTIVDGRSTDIPLIDMPLVGAVTIAETLERIRENNAIKAVVLRVNSPGGSALASEAMWRQLVLTARRKPVIVSMGSMAASGGYYVATPGARIFASPYSFTGSIGIFYGKTDISALFRKLGIGVYTTKTSPRADANTMYRPFTEDEVRHLSSQVKQMYDVFVDRVAKGRKMSVPSVDAVARGRVWMGRRALQHGLVDDLGGLRQAIERARQVAGLDPDAPIEEFPPPDFSLLSIATQLVQESKPSEALVKPAVLGEFSALLRAAVPLVVFEPFEPLALSEVVLAP